MIRCEVVDEHGDAVVHVDETILDQLTDSQRRALDDLIAHLPVEQLAREHMLAVLIRRAADQDAYERVCVERGLLPCLTRPTGGGLAQCVASTPGGAR